MSIRDVLNKHPSIVAGSLVVLIAAAGWYGFSQVKAMNSSSVETTYFSDDDGKTYFAADAFKVYPFSHAGRQSARAYVFECKGKRFVGYLSRYTEKAKAVIDKFRTEREAGRMPTNAGEMSQAISGGLEFKKPGDVNWVPAQIGSMMEAKCPDGSAATPLAQQ